MYSSKIIGYVVSIYIVIALVTSGFVGILIFEGIVDEGGVEAAIITVDDDGGGDYSSIQAANQGLGGHLQRH
jgi:hypothetical protein